MKTKMVNNYSCVHESTNTDILIYDTLCYAREIMTIEAVEMMSRIGLKLC